MRIIIDLGRLPDDPGKRADIDYALRTLANNGMIEALEWDRDDAHARPRQTNRRTEDSAE